MRQVSSGINHPDRQCSLHHFFSNRTLPTVRITKPAQVAQTVLPSAFPQPTPARISPEASQQ
jgi:hypothetical protein